MDQISFQFDASSYLASAALPLGILAVFVLLFIPSMLSPGAKPAGVGKAVYCYGLQGVGIFLMSIGGLPAVYGVVEKFALGTESYATETYLALLLLFATGGLLFLWHEQAADKIDAASAAVPAVLFWFTFKAVGFVLTVSSGLTLLLTMLLVKPLPPEWWVRPAVLLVYGLLLSWCTRAPKAAPRTVFQSSPIFTKSQSTVKKLRRSIGLPKMKRL